MHVFVPRNQNAIHLEQFSIKKLVNLHSVKERVALVPKDSISNRAHADVREKNLQADAQLVNHGPTKLAAVVATPI
jgi:hypothetical protein